MVIIAKNDFYTLETDIIKNRVFLTINGFWKKDNIPHYLEDWDKALKQVEKGFTLLTDARKMAIHPSEVRSIHLEAQKKIINAGVKKVAELQEQKVAEMQLNGVSTESALPKKNFTEKEKAISWLDE